MGDYLTYGLALAAGVGVLFFGAEWLVRGAARLASSLGVSPIVVGLTVVSLGTSAPELVVSLTAAPLSESDRALMQAHGIEMVVSKNSGGIAARAKLDAARALGLPVIMVDRPGMPERTVTTAPAEVMAWLGQAENLGV